MSLALKTQGILFQSGDGGVPEVFTSVGEVTSIDGPGGEASEIDVTHLASTAKEYLIGLPDEGNITLDCALLPDDVGQTRLRNDRVNATLRNYKITLTDSPATTITFSAFCKGFRMTAGIDAKMMASVTLRVSGAVTYNT